MGRSHRPASAATSPRAATSPSTVTSSSGHSYEEMASSGAKVAVHRQQVELAAAVDWTEVMARGGRMLAEGPPPLAEGYRGFTLLGRLGWREGSGLGREGEGRKEPARAEVMMRKFGRGLGFPAEKEEIGQDEVESLMKQNLEKDTVEDLVFGPDFEKEEVAMVKKAAGKLKVKVEKVTGEDEMTVLVVHCQIRMEEVMKELHRQKEGTSLYVGGTKYTLLKRAEEVVKEEKEEEVVRGMKVEIPFDYVKEEVRMLEEEIKDFNKKIKELNEEVRKEEVKMLEDKMEKGAKMFKEHMMKMMKEM